MEFINYIKNKAALSKLRQRALAIDSLKEKMAALSDEELKNKTLYFQKQFENVTDIKQERKIKRQTNLLFVVAKSNNFRLAG